MPFSEGHQTGELANGEFHSPVNSLHSYESAHENTSFLLNFSLSGISSSGLFLRVPDFCLKKMPNQKFCPSVRIVLCTGYGTGGEI
jgi:hypothetical protein